jgi:hypothetical protein
MGTRKTDHATETTINCRTCGSTYSPECDYQQGRCPHHPVLISKFPKWLLLVSVPFIIVPWIIMNPGKVWAQAKKDWNIK